MALSLEQWYVSKVIKGLTTQEKQSVVKMITEEFIQSMSPHDRKELVKIVLPDIVRQLMAGMDLNDRKELVETMVPLMIAEMESAKAVDHDKKQNGSREDPAKE